MTISLYDISVGTYLQILPALGGALDKGLAHCRETGTDPESLVSTRLFEDMLPLRFQVHQAVRHSVSAIEAIKAGQFSPGMPGTKRDDYKALQALVAEAVTRLRALTPAEVNAVAGRDILFVAGEMRATFTVELFIQSFSLPNFYFHCTTAYDILRMKGVPIGKRDFIGVWRPKA